MNDVKEVRWERNARCIALGFWECCCFANIEHWFLFGGEDGECGRTCRFEVWKYVVNIAKPKGTTQLISGQIDVLRKQ